MSFLCENRRRYLVPPCRVSCTVPQALPAVPWLPNQHRDTIDANLLRRFQSTSRSFLASTLSVIGDTAFNVQRRKTNALGDAPVYVLALIQQLRSTCAFRVLKSRLQNRLIRLKKPM